MTNDLAKDFRQFIEKYSVEQHFIRVNYLDGNSQICELSLYNIDKLNEEMVEQATQIIKKYTSEESKSARSLREVHASLTAATAILISSIAVELALGINEQRVLAEIGAALIIPTIVYLCVHKSHKRDEQEIKKYETFINNLDGFQEYGQKELLYQGIHKKGYVSINNLDVYTYEEVQRMADNLEKVRKKSKN